MHDTALRMPRRRDWTILALLLAAVVVFGVVVEIKTAFLSRRQGDLDVFLRAGWAVLVGEDIYDIRVENGWHYNYPPLYAILMVPFADPPLDQDRKGYMPFPVAVAFFYLLNIACAALASHVIARALERSADDPILRHQPVGCRRWWALRVVPIIVCLPPIGNSAMKGQVNLQILALLAAWGSCVLVRRRLRGGVFLALAMCIKVIPVYLLVQPLWKRDARGLVGCALGLTLGLVVVPLAVQGPARTVQEYRALGSVMFGPLLKLNDDQSRHKELLGVNGTDAVGVRNAIHNWIYTDKAQRPEAYLPIETATYVILGMLMTGATLCRWRGTSASWASAHETGALLVLMLAFAPISHVHYYCLCLPLVSSLLFARWQFRRDLTLDPALTLGLTWFTIANTLPSLPWLEVLKDRCLPLFGALPLWGIAVAQFWRKERVRQIDAPKIKRVRAAA